MDEQEKPNDESKQFVEASKADNLGTATGWIPTPEQARRMDEREAREEAERMAMANAALMQCTSQMGKLLGAVEALRAGRKIYSENAGKLVLYAIDNIGYGLSEDAMLTVLPSGITLTVGGRTFEMELKESTDE